MLCAVLCAVSVCCVVYLRVACCVLRVVCCVLCVMFIVCCVVGVVCVVCRVRGLCGVCGLWFVFSVVRFAFGLLCGRVMCFCGVFCV